LSRGERELIATYAARELDGGAEVVTATLDETERTAVSPKLKSLLDLAEKVRRGGKEVTSDDIAEARTHGADDVDIHDTVLIVAAFCMYNRYVDGLATWAPDDAAAYDAIAEVLLQGGYGAMLVE
jgi:alkylhydroperoxidase family enzyme